MATEWWYVANLQVPFDDIFWYPSDLWNEMRSLKMQQHIARICSMDGWSFYTTSNINDVKREAPCRDYCTLFFSTDMSLFDRVVQHFRKNEHQNVLPFMSLVTLDMHDLSHWYHEAKVEWNIQQNKNSSLILSTESKKWAHCLQRNGKEKDWFAKHKGIKIVRNTTEGYWQMGMLQSVWRREKLWRESGRRKKSLRKSIG